MRKTSLLSWPRARKWLNVKSYLDDLFALLERSRAALQQLLHPGRLLIRVSSHKRRTRYQPQIERLETRQLMTSTVFASGPITVLETDHVAVFAVSLDTPDYSNDITVQCQTNNGSALAGTDYTAVNNFTLTIPSGSGGGAVILSPC